MRIWNNNSLINLSGLSNLLSIGGNFEILDNDTLTGLTGLENLNSVGGSIQVFENQNLTNLTGLDNIIASTITNLDLNFNSSLSTCHVQSICDYLVTPNGTVDIHDNAFGCNSQQEVEDACTGVSVPEKSNELNFSIYPNPAENEIYIFGIDYSKLNELNIYNLNGMKVLQHFQTEGRFDISMLHPGIYIIEVLSGQLQFRDRLVVQ